MNKTTTSDIESKLTMNTETLSKYLDCGRSSAVKIGNEAGARIQIGRRVLWNILKVQKYLDKVSTE